MVNGEFLMVHSFSATVMESDATIKNSAFTISL
jgi:hypothetical protein